MRPDHMASLSLPANLSQIATIHGFVDQVGHDQNLDDQILHALHLVVGEACTNVIEHAYGGQGGPMELTLEARDDYIRVIIRDWGVAFDPAKVPIPDIGAPLEKRPVGGLGVYLMYQMMDDVHYHFSVEDGNTLIMVKRTPGIPSPTDRKPSAQVP